MAYDPIPKDFNPAETSANARGIVFHAGSRRRFIPYGCLLDVEITGDATELQFHYTHCTVVVTGRSLQSLHDFASEFVLAIVRESLLAVVIGPRPIVQRIEITEIADS
jgi:hypothetical protein